MNDPSIARQRETRTKVRRCRLEKELCASCSFSPRTDADDAHHPGVHMVEHMAMESTIADRSEVRRVGKGCGRTCRHWGETAYELRNSYWSSDVCSSDLRHRLGDGLFRFDRHRHTRHR